MKSYFAPEIRPNFMRLLMILCVLFAHACTGQDTTPEPDPEQLERERLDRVIARADSTYFAQQETRTASFVQSFEDKTLRVASADLLRIVLSADGTLLIDDQAAQQKELTERIKEFIINPSRRPELADSMQKAHVSFYAEPGSHQQRADDIVSIIEGTYRELWNEASRKIYGVPFDELRQVDRRDRIYRELPHQFINGHDLRVAPPPPPPPPVIERG